jgi:endonuclease-8
MPEGHTIHRLARDHNELLAKQTLRLASPQGRFEAGAELLDGRKLQRVEAAGKHLFYHFAAKPSPKPSPKSSLKASSKSSSTSKSAILHVHLGLFGKFRTHDNLPPAPRGAVRVRFTGKKNTVDLNGPNQCEVLDRAAYQEILDRLGPDPLRDDAEPDRAWARIHASRQPIGLLLMDQSVMAGIGNIYRSEILHLLKLHPRTPGTSVTRKQFDAIWALAVKLLRLGVEHNRIITIDEKLFPTNIARAPRKKLFRIFKKLACPDCGGKIHQFKLANRKVFACPVCQRESAA